MLFIPVISQLNFQHHYSSLQSNVLHMIRHDPSFDLYICEKTDDSDP